MPGAALVVDEEGEDASLGCQVQLLMMMMRRRRMTTTTRSDAGAHGGKRDACKVDAAEEGAGRGGGGGGGEGGGEENGGGDGGGERGSTQGVFVVMWESRSACVLCGIYRESDDG